MRKILATTFFLAFCIQLQGQSKVDNITSKEVSRIEAKLASDEMQGRGTFTPGIEKASVFIESEFQAAGLKNFNGLADFKQEFVVTESKTISSKVIIDGKEIDNAKIAFFSYQAQVNLTEKSGVEVVKINKNDDLRKKFNEYLNGTKSCLVLVDGSFSKALPIIQQIEKIKVNPGNNTVVFVFGINEANSFSIDLNNSIVQKKLNNVVGVLPGKSRPDEYVIFSAHYDHLGMGSHVEGLSHSATDSIYNGANDDASGCTAVILLANYFKQLNNNERTIIFTTFTAEEIGGFGSKYFSEQLDTNKVIAMFNLEMIGTDSKWGKNSAYITGFEKSNFGTILQKNLEKTNFKFYPDPYPKEQLFYRSDNATLAKLGVPAHTISTSKMDSEAHYHTADDEIETLDINNMTEIIKAIALSSSTIISGKDTPTRVDSSQLR